MSSKGLGFVGDGGLICGRKRCEFGAEAYEGSRFSTLGYKIEHKNMIN